MILLNVPNFGTKTDVVDLKNTIFLGMGLVLVLWFGGLFVLHFEGSKGGATGDDGGSDNTVIENAPARSGPVQEVYLKALSNGTYDKSEIVVRKGSPVKMHFTADPNAGCGRAMSIRGLNVSAISRNGEENVVTFTPKTEGTYAYNCPMGMWKSGRLVVKA